MEGWRHESAAPAPSYLRLRFPISEMNKLVGCCFRLHTAAPGATIKAEAIAVLGPFLWVRWIRSPVQAGTNGPTERSRSSAWRRTWAAGAA
jgi:hypothetical protein